MSDADSATTTADADGSLLEGPARLQLPAAALGGVGAYLLGYLLTYRWQADEVEETLQGFNFVADLLGGDPIPAWQGVGWLFYNAHFVTTQVPGFGGPSSENFIAASDDGTLTLLYLLPPLLLLLAGLAATYAADVSETREALLAGPGVLAGYLPLAIAGVFLFSFSVGDGAVEPDLVTAALLAGIVYPLAFGSLGGLLASVLRE